ncbi:MAG: hypothetical protein HYY20_05260 [Candidatus Tectomicrobia bacterium]|uniref:Rad50/SbcC-type AAA domain-containing protein n=1 Tax=Tectimicrobiota bacterium TaxID=2528274 RepID=A0A932CNE4_UNCTE|nr:hypothetical protein [Candidatus Tectomicrobia bacterium]
MTPIWKRLCLRGFGRYRDEVVLSLGPGINTLIERNEQGKSTLVYGLEAILFGLPGSTQPEQFGQARFRNWESPARFEGEVDFEVGGVDYRIERKFETHQVRFLRRSGNGWVEEMASSQNPRGRKRTLSYEERMKALLGLSSREVFGAIFCVGQPLPDQGQIHEAVQRLLAGAGSGPYGAARDRLSHDLKQLTQWTRSLGVAEKNGQKPRLLEQNGTERARLRQEIEGSRAVIDSLQSVQERLSELRARRSQEASRLQERQRLLEAWPRWQGLLAKQRDAVREQSALQRAYERAEQLSQEVARGRAALEREFQEFIGAAEGVGEALQELEGQERELAAAETERAGLQELWNEGLAQRQSLRDRLAAEFAPFMSNPELLRDHQELCQKVQELAELRRQRAALAAVEEQAARDLVRLEPWGVLGESPVTVLETLRRLAPEARSRWNRFEAERERLARTRDQLSGPLRPWEEALPDTLDLLKNYPSIRERLERAAALARQAAEAATRELKAYQAEEEAFRREFADLASLDDLALDRVERRIALIQQEAELTARLRETKAQSLEARKPALRMVLALITALVAGLGSGLLVVSWDIPLSPPAQGALVLLLGLGAGGGAWVLADGLTRDRFLEGRVLELERQIEALRPRGREMDARLGLRGEIDPVPWGEIRSRLLDRKARAEALALRRSALPSREKMIGLEASLRAAEQALSDFLRVTRGFAAGDPDILAVYARWRDCRREAELLQASLEAYVLSQFGCPVEQVDSLPARSLGGSWGQFYALAGLAKQPPETASGLGRWVASRDEAFWQDLLSRAREWEAAVKVQEKNRLRGEALLQPDPSGLSRERRLEEAIARLRQAMAPWDEHTPRPLLQGKVDACRQLQREVSTLEGRLPGLVEQRDRLNASLETKKNERQARRDALAPILSAAGGGVAAARGRYRSWRARREEIEGRAAELVGLLQGQGGADLEALHRKIVQAGNAARSAGDWLEQLNADFPGLPSPEEAEEGSGLESRYRSLDREVEELKASLARIDAEILQLLEEQSRLQGRDPLNLAQAEIVLGELEQEHVRFGLEAEALALAHRELMAAVKEYQESHRERLAETATGYFAAFTGVPGRRVILDDEFYVSLLEASGRPCALAQLSQGARDQLYLALRLAIADLMAGEIKLPFIFDDPFHNCDSERLARIREAVTVLGRERQVLLLSHREELASWGRRVELGGNPSNG